MNKKPTKTGEERHKHDWQMLSYGNRVGYVGSLTDMVVLMACRECNKVLEQKVDKFV
mgnify:CR=1 FL=1